MAIASRNCREAFRHTDGSSGLGTLDVCPILSARPFTLESEHFAVNDARFRVQASDASES